MMRLGVAAWLILLLGVAPAVAGSVPVTIDFEAAIRPAITDDSACYLARYPDIGTDAYWAAHLWDHYLTYGVREGRRWGCGPSTIQLMGTVGAPAAHGGFNYVHLAPGTELSGICAEFTVKVLHSEVLWQVFDGTTELLSAYNWGPGDVVKCLALVPPYTVTDGMIWIYAEGWGDASDVGIETQTQLWIVKP